MNTTELALRHATAACVSVMLLLLPSAPAFAQETEALQPTVDTSVRVTIETGLSAALWRAVNRFETLGFPTYESSSSCPAAAGSTTRMGVSYAVSRRAELGAFMTYDIARPRGCDDWQTSNHRQMAVMVGPSVLLRPLAASGLFFRLSVGATWLRGNSIIFGWTPRGVGASADVGYEIRRGPRATLFVTAGFLAGVGFDAYTVNVGMPSEREDSIRGRLLAGTLRVGASLH